MKVKEEEIFPVCNFKDKLIEGKRKARINVMKHKTSKYDTLKNIEMKKNFLLPKNMVQVVLPTVGVSVEMKTLMPIVTDM